MKYKLNDPIINFDSVDCLPWTLRNSFEGICITGGIGSGKTSGSGRSIALKYLKAGFGGLVLTTKPDEREQWENYCRMASRLDDLIIIKPGGEHTFDFLNYLCKTGDSNILTDNILQTLKTVIRAGDQKSGGHSDDAFWETALDQLITNAIELCFLAYGKVSVDLLYNIIKSAPQNETSTEKLSPNHFNKAFKKAQLNVKVKIEEWVKSLHWAEIEALKFDEKYDAALEEAVPSAKIYQLFDYFFFETFKKLSQKTRSVVEFTFSGFLNGLMREPIYSLFCKHKKDVPPEKSLEGKIILLDLPVKNYHKVGRDCQILYKYLWQVQMEKRSVLNDDRPVFLFADEAYNFLHEHDASFQATTRSSKVATVYIAQNIHQYYAYMGGEKAVDKVKSFLATLGTKIAHANPDRETNEFFSELIGDALMFDPSNAYTASEQFSQTNTVGLKLERQVRPEELVGLATGGERNDFFVEAYIHVQGDPLFKDQNFKKIQFSQNYI